MASPLSFLHGGEKAAFLLRELYEQYGYLLYRMRKFEEYDFYTGHKDFLSSGQILTFTDLNGKLMALKPDVTMSIVKRTRATPDRPERIYYHERIYRPAANANEFREITQVGLEYIGRVTAEVNAEIVLLAHKSLAAMHDSYILDISHNGFISGIFESVNAPPEAKHEIARLISRKNAHDLAKYLVDCKISGEDADRLTKLFALNDMRPQHQLYTRSPQHAQHPQYTRSAQHAQYAQNPQQTLQAQNTQNPQHTLQSQNALQAQQAHDRASTPDGSFAKSLREAKELAINDKTAAALDELELLYGNFAGGPAANCMRLDFSLANESSYYNGLLMRGYIESSPRAVLSGGRYDPLLQRLGAEGLEAIGFAVYLDEVERADNVGVNVGAAEANCQSHMVVATKENIRVCNIDAAVAIYSSAEGSGVYASSNRVDADTLPNADNLKMLRVALPKGRMGDAAYALFAAAGYSAGENIDDSRKLVFVNDAASVSFLLIKPQDVAVYVERGAADVGVVGKDVILETEPDVYELLDLGFGRCRLATAGPESYEDDLGSVLRVATKYPNVAKKYYAQQNRDIEIITLNGSIELAPILGVSDVIVDIVETGTTLKDNNLAVLEEIAPSSARLISNVNAYKFKHREISLLLDKLTERGEK